MAEIIREEPSSPDPCDDAIMCRCEWCAAPVWLSPEEEARLWYAGEPIYCSESCEEASTIA